MLLVFLLCLLKAVVEELALRTGWFGVPKIAREALVGPNYIGDSVRRAEFI